MRAADDISRVERLVDEAAKVALTADHVAEDFERFADRDRRLAQKWRTQAEELRRLVAEKAEYIQRLAGA